MLLFARLTALWVCLSYIQICTADAVVRSQAMFATSIAEYFVSEEQVLVELEIGLEDLGAFRNLMPDAVYEEMGHSPRPLAERLTEFFNEDLVILGDGVPLEGQLLNIGPRARVKRDDITGEALPAVAQGEETVIAARMSYAFGSERPSSLSFVPPIRFESPNIGFVVYHNTVAVNDFRYLSRGTTLDLDWTDAWYSAFRSRALRRSYFAPMSGFLYIEPFEVRKEVIVRPKDIQRWVDIGLEGATHIEAQKRGVVLERIATFLTSMQAVTIDGETVTPTLDRANFLNRTLRSAMVVDAGLDIDINSAVVGVIFVYPTADLPDNATMTWDMFDQKVEVVPAASVDEAGALPTMLKPDYPVLEWQNFLTAPTIPGQIELADPPAAMVLWLYDVRWWALGLAVSLIVLWRWRQSPVLAGTAVITMLVVALSFLFGRPLAPQGQATETVVADLLRNVYQAFDYREESDIYDALERNVSGELLTQTYIETRRSLELASQGGARTKVKSVEFQEIEISSATEEGAFIADATWNVVGSVGHWGHVHTRTNQYHAELLIQARDNRWKLVGMKILEETRL